MLLIAVDDGDRIHAIIRGSAVGNAGHSRRRVDRSVRFRTSRVIRSALCITGMDSTEVH